MENVEYKKLNQIDEKYCHHPQHEFPTMIYIPPGQELSHKCPGCGHITKKKGSDF